MMKGEIDFTLLIRELDFAIELGEIDLFNVLLFYLSLGCQALFDWIE